MKLKLSEVEMLPWNKIIKGGDEREGSGRWGNEHYDIGICWSNGERNKWDRRGDYSEGEGVGGNWVEEGKMEMI